MAKTDSFSGLPIQELFSERATREFDFKAMLEEIINLVNDLKSKYDDLVTLVNEIKADHNAHLAAASMHYDGSASVTDTVNVVTTADGAATTQPAVDNS